MAFRLRPPSGQCHLLHKGRRIPVAPVRSDAVSDRSRRGDILARLCPADPFLKMGKDFRQPREERRLCPHRLPLCPCPCRFLQFHALHGRPRRRHRLGPPIPLLSRPLLLHHPFPCPLGRRRLYLVPDMIIGLSRLSLFVISMPFCDICCPEY